MSDPNDARCEAIEEHRLLITESQVLQGAVHVSECHRECACGRGPVTILSSQCQRGGTIRRNARGKRDTDDGARSKPDPLAKCPDGIEDRAGRARERPAIQHNGIDDRTPAADEPRPVRLPLDGATEARTVDAEHMETHHR